VGPRCRGPRLPQRETEYRPLAAANGGTGREGRAPGHRRLAGDHNTTAKHRRRPSSVNCTTIERKIGIEEKKGAPKILTSGGSQARWSSGCREVPGADAIVTPDEAETSTGAVQSRRSTWRGHDGARLNAVEAELGHGRAKAREKMGGVE
jgi:hypothetical protein